MPASLKPVPEKSAARPEAAPSLAALIEATKSDMGEVADYIDTHIKSPVKLVGEVSQHLLGRGGKAIRPMLSLACSSLNGYEGKAHIGIAACVELIHNATLFHDDVVDEGEVRRGRMSANKAWGNAAAVLTGDFLFARAFQIMVAEGSHRVLAILSSAAATIAEGEVLQLSARKKQDTSFDTYLGVIRAKTGALFEAACATGAALAEKTQEQEQKMADFGMNLGIAFQMEDDLLDYVGEQERLGKKTGHDFHEGKLTLPVLLALDRATPDETRFIRACFAKKQRQDDELQSLTDIFAKYDIIARAKEQSVGFSSQAREALFSFPQSRLRDALEEALYFTTRRKV